MITTKTIYITTDGTEFSESKYLNAQKLAEEHEDNYLKQTKSLNTDVLCLDKQGLKCDYMDAEYVKITSQEGVEALITLCQQENFCTIWEYNNLEEKAGFYAWDNNNQDWINLEEEILKYEKIKAMLENFKTTE